MRQSRSNPDAHLQFEFYVRGDARRPPASVALQCPGFLVHNPTHPVGRSDNIRSAVSGIRSSRDVAAERGFLMSPLVDAVKLFEACDRGAARGAVRAPRRWRGVARGGGPVARHVSFFRSEGPSKGNL